MADKINYKDANHADTRAAFNDVKKNRERRSDMPFVEASMLEKTVRAGVYAVATAAAIAVTAGLGSMISAGIHYFVDKPQIEMAVSARSKAEARVSSLDKSLRQVSGSLADIRAVNENDLEQLLRRDSSLKVSLNGQGVKDGKSAYSGSNNNEVRVEAVIPGRYLKFGGGRTPVISLIHRDSDSDGEKFIKGSSAPKIIPPGTIVTYVFRKGSSIPWIKYSGEKAVLEHNFPVNLPNGDHTLEAHVYLLSDELAKQVTVESYKGVKWTAIDPAGKINDGGGTVHVPKVASLESNLSISVDHYKYPCIYKSMEEWKANRDKCRYPFADIPLSGEKGKVLGSILNNVNVDLTSTKNLNQALDMARMDPCVYADNTYNPNKCVNPGTVELESGIFGPGRVIFSYTESRPEKLKIIDTKKAEKKKSSPDLLIAPEWPCAYPNYQSWLENKDNCETSQMRFDVKSNYTIPQGRFDIKRSNYDGR